MARLLFLQPHASGTIYERLDTEFGSGGITATLERTLPGLVHQTAGEIFEHVAPGLKDVERLRDGGKVRGLLPPFQVRTTQPKLAIIAGAYKPIVTVTVIFERKGNLWKNTIPSTAPQKIFPKRASDCHTSGCHPVFGLVVNAHAFPDGCHENVRFKSPV
jgi:hypothetical protein